MFPRLPTLLLGTLVLFFVVHLSSRHAPLTNVESMPVQYAAFSTGDQSKSEARDVVIDERFKVRAGETLEIDVVHSDVEIRTGSSSEVHVRVEVSNDNGRAFFEHLNYSVEKRGDVVSVTTNPRGNWNRRGGGIDVYVSVPEDFNAEVNLSHGDLEVERMNGRLAYEIAHGDISAGSLSGSSLHLESAHGDVDAETIVSEKVLIRAAHGDISVGSLSAAEFEADVQHGDVEIDRAEGYARVSGSHSDISVGFFKLAGGSFSTTHGDIEITAPAGTAADVDFSADDIEIASGHSFQGTLVEKRAEGRINGGGSRLEARSSHGEISFRDR